MKDLLIILLLIGLLWGGYKGMTFLGDFVQSNTTESTEEPLADKAEKRINKSMYDEAKNEITAIKKTEAIASNTEKTNGQKAMDIVRGNDRLDAEGNVRNKEDFYKESNTNETPPYERKDIPNKKTPTANQSDIKEREVALAEKGKALAGEFQAKGSNTTKTRKSKAKTSFNIEKGETEEETPTSPTRPQEYNQPVKKFIPSKYVLVVGSYASADNAVKEVSRLRKAGYPKANIVLSEKNLNLVSLGSFADKAAANAQAAEIKKAGIDLYVKGIR